jgi:hypothetical protein
MLEKLSLPMLAVGASLVALGLLWVMIVAFRSGFITRALLPLLVILIGAGVALAIPVYNRLYPTPVQSTAQVFGDGITITGATKDQLEVVMGHKGWKTIQAANRKDQPLDLTDEELVGLDGMTELEFINLNGNPITDATLERLVRLPKLTKLYISRTKVTPDGLKKHVFDNGGTTVTEIEISDLNVPGKVAREWENGKKGRKVSQ